MTPLRLSRFILAATATLFFLPSLAQNPQPASKLSAPSTLLLTSPLMAAEAPQQPSGGPPGAAAGPAQKEGPSSALPADSVSHRTVEISGDPITYTATAGSLPLQGAKGETAAKLFYVSYVRDEQPGTRPLTFVFNGGPGAAAAFLHLGALGPRVLNFNEAGSSPVQPVQLADNPDSWLEFTDLVFVDPVGTGFSRPTAEGEDAERAYYGVTKDADALTDFIRLYLARSGRSLSPIFLAGESYGGFRAMLLARRLLASGTDVKGAVLISPALEFALIRGDEYTLLPLALALPSIAASNIELREGLEGSLDSMGEVESFARTGYLLYLAAGLKRDDGVIELLERYTGLDKDTIARHHGRVSASLFLREYRRRNDKTLSRYDGSVGAPVPRPGDDERFDPVLDRAITALTPAMIHYVREELGFRTDLEYKLLNREVSSKWDYGTTPSRQGFADALDDLQQARTHNPGLKILITHGYTDLVTPYGVSQFLIDQLKPIEGAQPLALRVYRGGHMMYFRAPSRRQLQEDVRELYQSSAEPPND